MLVNLCMSSTSYVEEAPERLQINLRISAITPCAFYGNSGVNCIVLSLAISPFRVYDIRECDPSAYQQKDSRHSDSSSYPYNNLQIVLAISKPNTLVKGSPRASGQPAAKKFRLQP